MISLEASSRLALKIGCFFSASTTIFKANEVSVRRAPFFSYCGAYFLRSSIKPVMSAWSNWVTWGMVVQLSDIRSLIVLRMGESGFLVISPHFEKSIDGGATAAGRPAVVRG